MELFKDNNDQYVMAESFDKACLELKAYYKRLEILQVEAKLDSLKWAPSAGTPTYGHYSEMLPTTFSSVEFVTGIVIMPDKPYTGGWPVVGVEDE